MPLEIALHIRPVKNYHNLFDSILKVGIRKGRLIDYLNLSTVVRDKGYTPRLDKFGDSDPKRFPLTGMYTEAMLRNEASLVLSD